MMKIPRLRSLVLSGECSGWLDDANLAALVNAGNAATLRRVTVTGKVMRN